MRGKEEGRMEGLRKQARVHRYNTRVWSRPASRASISNGRADTGPTTTTDTTTTTYNVLGHRRRPMRPRQQSLISRVEWGAAAGGGGLPERAPKGRERVARDTECRDLGDKVYGGRVARERE